VKKRLNPILLAAVVSTLGTVGGNLGAALIREKVSINPIVTASLVISCTALLITILLISTRG